MTESQILDLYEEHQREETFYKGRFLVLCAFVLSLGALLVDLYYNLGTFVFTMRGLNTILYLCFSVAAYREWAFLKRHVIYLYFFVVCFSFFCLMSMGLFLMSGGESSKVLELFLTSLAVMMLVGPFLSLGATRLVILYLPIFVLVYNAGVLVLNREEYLHLVLVDSLLVFSFLFVRNKVESDFDVFRSIKLLEQNEYKMGSYTNHLLSVNRALSHDLKTPLRTIGSFSQLLKRKLIKGGDKDSLEYLDFIINGVGQMNRLLKDILQYSEITQADKKNQTRIDLNSILARIKVTFEPIFRENNITCKVESLPEIKADEVRIFLLFHNLIENAIKYNESEHPEVKISSKKGQNYVLVAVEDNGIGIDALYYDKIFNIFERLHSGATYTGTGIGLATCKEIMEQNQGKIWVESVVGEGSIFYLEFPLLEEHTN